MKKTILYIVRWCLCAGVAAQTPVADSLERVLSSVKDNSFEKAELLKNIANEYTDIDTAKCRMYALRAIREAQNIGSKKIEAAANIALANMYRNTLVDTAKHRSYALKALHLVQNTKGSEMQEGVAHISLGIYYMNVGQHYLSHVHYKRAEKLFLQLNDKERLSIVYQNLISLFAEIDDNENVMHYVDKLLKMNIGPNELYTKLYIGWTIFKEKPSQEALDYFLDLYHQSIFLKSQFIDEIAILCIEEYLLLNRPHEALQLLHRIRESRNLINRDALLSVAHFLYAHAYADLHQVDSAEYYLKKTINGNLIQNTFRVQLHNIRSNLDSIKGDYRKALENYKIYHHLSDSIAKAGKTAAMAQMKNWHELEQKDHENQLLQQEGQKQQRLILILAGALVMICVLLALSVFFYRKTAEKNREMKKLNTVKDKLFSVVAHDLRNPMGALMSVLKLANENMLDAETQARLLKDISTRVDDIYNLIDNLLHWSKSQMQGMVPSPAYFDVQDGSRTITDSLQHIAATKTITLNNHIEKQQVYADRDMFSVVVRNLCMNAIKYTSAGGKVTLASELSGNTLIISVKDNGTGMTQEVQDQLFKLSETKSRRGTNNESGTGLGLVLCADFVKANGGSIWFSSKDGEGSTFSFSMPVKYEKGK